MLRHPALHSLRMPGERSTDFPSTSKLGNPSNCPCAPQTLSVPPQTVPVCPKLSLCPPKLSLCPSPGHWERERGKKSQTEVIRSSQGSGDNDLPSFTFSQERFLRPISHAGNGEGMSHKLAAEERNARLMETTDISRSHGPISALTLAHNLWLTVFQLLLSWLQHKTAIAASRGIQMFNSTASST